jgi:hypothetical protein
MTTPDREQALCKQCAGNGVVKIGGGIASPDDTDVIGCKACQATGREQALGGCVDLLRRMEFGYFYASMPARWPVWARRLFVVTLPVSGPLLLIWWLLLPIGGAVALSLWFLFLGLCWAISPVVMLVQSLVGLWRAQ